MLFIYQTAAIAAGVILDFIIGDPRWIYHPVRLIGRLISSLESLIRRVFPKTKRGELVGGVLIVILTVIITGGVTLILAIGTYKINPWLYFAVEAVMCCFLLAAKSLKTESMRVYYKLMQDDTEGARESVSMIVGRDTERLGRSGIIKAAVETVAENTSDGVTAPLLYMMIGGAPLGFVYKAVNTMDSMLGYKNDKYLYFGCAAARTDDFANFIPARITAWIMILSAKICGFDYRNAKKIYRRDRANHASPNSAHTEAVCAGALDVRLAGDAFYFGKLYKKPYIGDDLRPIESEDIPRANRLMYTTAVITAAAVCAVRIAGGILLW